MGEHRPKKAGGTGRETPVERALKESFHWLLDGKGAIKSVTALRTKTDPAFQKKMNGQPLWSFGAEPEDRGRLKASIADALLTVEDGSFYCRMKCISQSALVHVRVVTVQSDAGHELSIFTQAVLDGHDSLSTQETQTLILLGRGCDAKRIAEEMQCSPSTIQTFILRARKKLGIFNFVELVTYCAHTFSIP